MLSRTDGMQLQQQTDRMLFMRLQATMLDKIKRDTEELLKLALENYYLLSSAARKGILDGTTPPPGDEFPPEALVAAMHLFECMRDVFHPSDVEWLNDRFRLAAKARWQRLACACDDGNGGNGYQVMLDKVSQLLGMARAARKCYLLQIYL